MGKRLMEMLARVRRVAASEEKVTPCPDVDVCGGVLWPPESEIHSWDCRVSAMARNAVPPAYGGAETDEWTEWWTAAIFTAAKDFKEGKRPEPKHPEARRLEGWA